MIKLVCFDVDGTLVDNIEYSWQMFHNEFNTDPKERDANKRKYFNKEISYIEWANLDIAIWEKAGIKRQDFFLAMQKSKIKLMNGAHETISELKKRGIRIAIISGTINVILEYLLPDYETIFSDVYLTKIYFDGNGKIAKYDATQYDMDGKARALIEIAKREGLQLNECAFIGDHNNDIEIAKEAGLSIAFDPRMKN
jgi:phosphoserine phosphatase